jgi:hypothetical protein
MHADSAKTLGWGLYMQRSYRRSLWSAFVLVVIDLEPLSFVS